MGRCPRCGADGMAGLTHVCPMPSNVIRFPVERATARSVGTPPQRDLSGLEPVGPYCTAALIVSGHTEVSATFNGRPVHVQHASGLGVAIRLRP